MRVLRRAFIALLVVAGVAYATHVASVAYYPTKYIAGWRWYPCYVPALGDTITGAVVNTADTSYIAYVTNAITASDTLVLFQAPFNGKLHGVQFTPQETMTGDSTYMERFIIAVTSAAGAITKIDSVDFGTGTSWTARLPYALYDHANSTDGTTVVRDGCVLLIRTPADGDSGYVKPSSGLANVLFDGRY